MLKGMRTGIYTDFVKIYTERLLRFPNNILRAFQETLFQTYGPRTYFGLPWGDFDRPILLVVTE
jgi:hypothetical protein